MAIFRQPRFTDAVHGDEWVLSFLSFVAILNAVPKSSESDWAAQGFEIPSGHLALFFTDLLDWDPIPLRFKRWCSLSLPVASGLQGAIMDFSMLLSPNFFCRSPWDWSTCPSSFRPTSNSLLLFPRVPHLLWLVPFSFDAAMVRYLLFFSPSYRRHYLLPMAVELRLVGVTSLYFHTSCGDFLLPRAIAFVSGGGSSRPFLPCLSPNNLLLASSRHLFLRNDKLGAL